MRTVEVLLSKGSFAPGESVSGHVLLCCDKPFKCDRVTASLFGEEMSRVSHGSGKHRHTHVERRIHFDQTIEIGQPGELAPGDSGFEFSFALPGGIPGSYDGEHGHISYVLNAEAEIPWGVNLHASKPVPVAWVVAPVVGERRAHTLGQAGVPVLRVDVENDVIEPGIDIPVRFMLVGEPRCRGVRLAILSCEAVAPHGASATSENTLAEVYYRLDEIHLGMSTKHIFRIDRNLYPSFRTSLIAFTYSLKVTLDIRAGFDENVLIPLRSPAYTPSSAAKGA